LGSRILPLRASVIAIRGLNAYFRSQIEQANTAAPKLPFQIRNVFGGRTQATS